MCTVQIEGWVIEVEITAFYPGLPAKLSALPENCYPEEPAEVDFEILSAEFEDGEPTPALPADEDLYDAVLLRAEENATEHWEYLHNEP